MTTETTTQYLPLSKARNNFSSLVEQVKKNKKKYYLIKNYEPQAVLINVEYLRVLEEKYLQREMGDLLQEMGEEFTQALKAKGYNPETVTEAEVNKFLKLDD